MDHERILRAKATMEAADLDAMVCRLPENVKLLSGHWPLVGLTFLVFPLEGTPVLIVPHCDEGEAAVEAWEANLISFRYAVLDAQDPYTVITRELKTAAKKSGWKRVGFEGSFETVAPPWNAAEPAIPASITRNMLEEVFCEMSLVDATDVLMNLRAKKTPDEQEKLRIVNRISTIGLSAFKTSVDIGITGVELVAEVERAIMVGGSNTPGVSRVRGFAQVATGADETAIGYRPMEVSTNRPMENGDLALLELAVVADGFWCDRTRTVVAGTPTQKQTEMFQAVQAAQEAAIATVAPGITCGQVDRAARSIIHEAGFTDDEFLHVTGHGLGFRYHEPVPLLLPDSDEMLEEGMLTTVEPGVYLSGHGGIRTEDNVFVTSASAEVLGPFCKELT